MIIFLVPFFSRRRCTNQLQMEKSLWTACVRKISCLALKLTRYNVKKIKKFLLIDEKCIFFFFLTIWDLCLLVMLLVINFSFFFVFQGLVPLPGSNNESWCQGLDGLASRSTEYYKQGARFAKW